MSHHKYLFIHDKNQYRLQISIGRFVVQVCKTYVIFVNIYNVLL